MTHIKYLTLILTVILSFHIVGCFPNNEATNDKLPKSLGEIEKVPIEKAKKQPELGESDFVSATKQSGQLIEDYSNYNGDNGSTNSNSDNNAPERGSSDASIEEADIYKMYGNDILLNLNSFRGLQIIDLSNVEKPEILSSIQVSGEPVELYIKDQVAYILISGFTTYYYEASKFAPSQFVGSLVMTVDISDLSNPVILSKLQVDGTINTSRIVTKDESITLYVVSNRYNYYWDEPSRNAADEPPSSNSPSTFITSYNITNPQSISEITSLRMEGTSDSRVVHATTEAIVIPFGEYNRDDGQWTRLAYIDISEATDELKIDLEFTVQGRVQNKFNMDLHNNVLRVVSHVRNRWFDNNSIEEESDLNHLYTFDVNEPGSAIASRLLDEKSFGGQEDLFATIFVDNKAFFVTYFRTDPFHAFEIKDDGSIIEHNEFFISGWNNFFKVIENKQRLMGVGINDDNGRNLAVSLYDISHLSPEANEEPETDINDLSCGRWPCLDREQMDSDWSDSEAQWDERAFTVLENVVNVSGTSGEETGLILLPFSGWNYDCDFSEDGCKDYYQTGVQVFTFNSENITKRGILNHNSEVKRSFLAADHIASLSNKTLSLFDFSDINNPSHVSSLDLAAFVSDFFVFGDYGVRINKINTNSNYNSRSNCEQTEALLQVINLDDGELVEGINEIELKCEARGEFIKSENLLVNVFSKRVNGSSEEQITIYDFSNPELPVVKSIISTDKNLTPNYDNYYDDCWDCYGENSSTNSMNFNSNNMMDGEMADNGVGFNSQALAVAPGWETYKTYKTAVLSNAIAFLVETSKTKEIGTEEKCSWEPTGGYEDYSDCYGNYYNTETNSWTNSESNSWSNNDSNSWSNSDSQNNASNGDSNSWSNSDSQNNASNGEFNGTSNSMNSEFPEDEAPPYYEDADYDYCEYSDYICDGEGDEMTCKQCKFYEDGREECINLEIVKTCFDEVIIKRYQVVNIEILNLEDPDQPVFADTIEIDKDQNMLYQGFISDDSSIHINYSMPVEVEDTENSYSRYYFQSINLNNVNNPEFGPEINIPGSLRLLDGSRIVTEDFSWRESSNYDLIHSLAVLNVQEDRAVLQAIRTFDTDVMETVFLDADYAYIIQDEDYYYNDNMYTGRSSNFGSNMIIIELDDPEMAEISNIELDRWSNLKMVDKNKAFFSVNGGLLVVDLSDITLPAAQAFLSLKGWPQSVIVNTDKVFVPAGVYGLYLFDLDYRNLEVIE